MSDMAIYRSTLLRGSLSFALAEVYNASPSLTINKKTKEDVCVDHCGCWQSLWDSSWHGPLAAFRRKGTRLPSLIRIMRVLLNCRMPTEQVFPPRRCGETQIPARLARTRNSCPDGMLAGTPILPMYGS